MMPLLRPLLAGLLGLAAVSAAGDAGVPQAAPAQPPGAPAAQPPQAPAAQPTPAPPEQEIEDFVPTERLSADDAVSFPTDI